jgi:hypothetical protein
MNLTRKLERMSRTGVASASIRVSPHSVEETSLSSGYVYANGEHLGYRKTPLSPQ